MVVFSLIRTFAFGPFLLLAFFVGLYFFWKKAVEEYYEQDDIFEAALNASFWGFIGARLGFIALHYAVFGFDLLKWLSVFAYPGYVGFAGILCGLVYMFFFAREKKWDVYEVLDFASIGLSISLVLMYIGMFINGSGFGSSTTLPIGLPFPGVFDKRHPVQLYAAMLYLVLFFVLWRLEKIYRTFLWYRTNKRTAQSGFLLSMFCFGYGGITLVISFFRVSVIQFFSLDIEFYVGLGFLVAGAMILFNRSGRRLSWIKRKKPVALS